MLEAGEWFEVNSPHHDISSLLSPIKDPLIVGSNKDRLRKRLRFTLSLLNVCGRDCLSSSVNWRLRFVDTDGVLKKISGSASTSISSPFDEFVVRESNAEGLR